MSTTRNDALAPLGRLMEQRRRDLGMTLSELAGAAGLSVETIRAVRYGQVVPHGLTRASIERGLRWAPGTVDRFYADGTLPEGAAPAAEPDRAAAAAVIFPGDEVAQKIVTQTGKSPEAIRRDLMNWLVTQDRAAREDAR